MDGALQSVLVIDVERCVPVLRIHQSYPVGRFGLHGQSLVLGDPFLPSLLQRRPLCQTLPTSFGKQSFRNSGNDTPKFVTFNNENYYRPVFGRVSGISGARDQKWALGFDETRNDRVTGYVTTVNTRTSYFTYPPWPDEFGTYTSDVFQNSLTPRLLDSSTTYENLDQVYKFWARSQQRQQTLSSASEMDPGMSFQPLMQFTIGNLAFMSLC